MASFIFCAFSRRSSRFLSSSDNSDELVVAVSELFVLSVSGVDDNASLAKPFIAPLGLTSNTVSAFVGGS